MAEDQVEGRRIPQIVVVKDELVELFVLVAHHVAVHSLLFVVEVFIVRDVQPGCIESLPS